VNRSLREERKKNQGLESQKPESSGIRFEGSFTRRKKQKAGRRERAEKKLHLPIPGSGRGGNSGHQEKHIGVGEFWKSRVPDFKGGKEEGNENLREKKDTCHLRKRGKNTPTDIRGITMIRNHDSKVLELPHELQNRRDNRKRRASKI